ncbi:MAG: patatin family protein, partial [Spirochaetaceae bacterium]|nr:patatin family protein [Spirochaetaceae bacterium]
MTQIYKQTPIPGKALEKILPKGCALVLEGGGTRGFYSAGVFEAFIDAGIMFPYIIGVSAGAANVLSYIAGQRGRNRQIVEKYVGNPKYVSKRNLLFHRSFFGMEFIFHEVPQKHVFLDWEMLNKQDITLLTGALDCNTGKTIWFNKNDVTPTLEATMASCSVPFLSPIFKFQGYKLLDGGIADPIPIEKSVSDGNTFHVIVLTRNKGYQKSVFKHKNILKLFYSKYPKLIEAILNRHTVYNRQLALCEQLEKEGKAIIIRPLKPLQVNDSTGRDIEKLLELY